MRATLGVGPCVASRCDVREAKAQLVTLGASSLSMSPGVGRARWWPVPLRMCRRVFDPSAGPVVSLGRSVICAEGEAGLQPSCGCAAHGAYPLGTAARFATMTLRPIGPGEVKKSRLARNPLNLCTPRTDIGTGWGRLPRWHFDP